MEIMEDNQVLACRICLQVDCKLYSLKRYKLDKSYQLLTGLSLDDEDTLPMSLCVECSTLLCKYRQFREKSHVAYECLIDMVKYNFEVTLDDVKEFNRNKLGSHLSTIHKQPNYFDYHFVEETPLKLGSVVKFENSCDFVDSFDSTDNDFSEDSNKYESENDVPFKFFRNQIIIDGNILDKLKNPKEKCNTSLKDFVEKNHYDNQFQDESHLIELETKTKVQPIVEFCPEVEFDETNSIKDCFDTTDDERKDLDHEYQNICKDKKQKNIVNATTSKDMNKKEIIKKPKDIIKVWTHDFNIKSLTVEEQKEMIFMRKSSDQYVNAKYKCDYCFKGFLRERTLKTHMLNHSEKNGHFICEICQKHCRDKRKLYLHLSRHSHIYSCKSCPYTTQSSCSAKLHFDWHKGQIYKCKLCNESYVRISSLKSHERVKHPSDNVCSLCGYSFIGESGVKQHQILKHRQENVELPPDSPRCELCNISFVSMEALQTHHEVSLRHEGGGPLKRNEPVPEYVRCYRTKTSGRVKTKSDKPNIIKHGKIVCEQCGVHLRSPRALKQHVARYHPSQRVIGPNDPLCHLCGKTFTSAAHLRNHLPVHSDTASFSCKFCSKKFKTPMNLKQHERIHDNMSFPCPQCEKTFNNKSNRDRHLTYTHSDVKNVKCDYCDKRFKKYEEKKSHTDHVHFNKPWPLKKNPVRKGRSSTVKITRKKETPEDSDD